MSLSFLLSGAQLTRDQQGVRSELKAHILAIEKEAGVIADEVEKEVCSALLDFGRERLELMDEFAEERQRDPPCSAPGGNQHL